MLLFGDKTVAVGIDPREHVADALRKLLLHKFSIAVAIVLSEELVNRRTAAGRGRFSLRFRPLWLAGDGLLHLLATPFRDIKTRA